MSEDKPRVRIVVAQPRDAHSGDGLGTVSVLERLGRGVEIEVVHDAEHCIARCRAGDVDLVVCERELGRGADRVLESLRPTGPPVLVTVRDARDEAALDAFRRGAADVVAGGPGFADALPVAALEQIHGWRAARDLDRLQRRVAQTEKLASIGQLAAGVAHEINNPMGFVHANLCQMAEYVADLRRAWERVEALQRAASGGDADAVHEAARALAETSDELGVPFLLQDLATAVRESREGSERVRHIVQDLREFSHQDAGATQLADVNQCLDSTADIVWPMMKHIVVLERHYGELPLLRCAPMQLKQVFMNLLVNAYQAIEERVGDSGEMGRIELLTELRGDRIAITISDTGCGVPPELLDRLFDPFFTTKKVGTGTGLGLSTSFRIVQAHGGTLGVDSRLGEGARFEISLPLARKGGDAA